MNPKVMDDRILRRSRRSFQSFVSLLSEQVPRPTAKFIRSFLCGVVFSRDLIFTHVAGHVPQAGLSARQAGRLTATAKRFRRHLNCDRVFILDVLSGYWRWLKKRLDTDSLFIVDLTDLGQAAGEETGVSGHRAGWGYRPVGCGLLVPGDLRFGPGRDLGAGDPLAVQCQRRG